MNQVTAATTLAISTIFSSPSPVRMKPRGPKIFFQPEMGLSLFRSVAMAFGVSCTPIWP